MKYPVTAYVCMENEESYERGVLNHINIYDLASEYREIPANGHAYFDTQYLKTYKDGLSQAGIKYKETKFNGVNAVEYEFNQNGLPTKAIMFVKNQKSYLLQVSTRNGLVSKYNNLKLSFRSI